MIQRVSTRNQLTTALSSWRRTRHTKRCRSDNDMFVFRMISTGSYIKSRSLMYSRLHICSGWYAVPMVAKASCLCCVYAKDEFTFRASVRSTHDHLHHAANQIDSCNNKLFVHDHRWLQSSRLPLSYCTQLVTTCFVCFCILCCTIIVIPYTHTHSCTASLHKSRGYVYQ